MISRATQTPRQQLEEQGFTVIPFPVNLLEAMRAHIAKHLSQVLDRELCGWNNVEELGVACTHLERNAFEAHIGNQAARIYPAAISRLIREELKPHLCQLFEIERIDLLKALPKHILENPQIGKDACFCHWRFVAPGHNEATPAHADSHFNRIHEEDDEHLESLIAVDEMWKLWIPLFNCTKGNSVQVIPQTHREQIPWSKVLVNGVHKPQIDSEWLSRREKDFICPMGNTQNSALLFSEDLTCLGSSDQ